jgi:hypothetical protein
MKVTQNQYITTPGKMKRSPFFPNLKISELKKHNSLNRNEGVMKTN